LNEEPVSPERSDPSIPLRASKPQGKSSWLQLLWKNKFYVILAVLLGFLILRGQFSEETKREKKVQKEKSAQMQAKLKEAEESFQKIVKDKGSFENYLKENPKLAATLNYAALFLFALLLYGIWLDFWCLLRRWKKKPILETLSLKALPRWVIPDVFKVMILFVGVSVFLGGLLEAVETFAPHVLSENGRLILHGTLSDLIALGLVLLFSQVKYKQAFFQMQIRLENVWKDIGIGISAYLAVLPLVLGLLLLLVWIVSLFHYEPPPQKVVEVFIEEGAKNPLLVLYTMFLATVIGPALEEIFFRGFFYSALRKKYSPVPSALITGVFFALLHESSFAFLPIFLLSLLLTYVYEKRKSLVAPIALHIFHNTLFLGYFFLMKENFLDKFLH
jgi:membrane protease YdiL (CAAX protease family)